MNFVFCAVRADLEEGTPTNVQLLVLAKSSHRLYAFLFTSASSSFLLLLLVVVVVYYCKRYFTFRVLEKSYVASRVVKMAANACILLFKAREVRSSVCRWAAFALSIFYA